MLSCHYFPRRGEFSLARLTVGGLDSPWRDDDDDHTTQMGEITLSRLSISTSKENKLGQFISIFRTFSQCLKIAQKVAFKIASEASYVYNLSGQKFIKNASNFSDFVKLTKYFIYFIVYFD